MNTFIQKPKNRKVATGQKKMVFQKFLAREDGFSLMELIVTLVIIGSISAIAYGVVLLNARMFGTLSGEISTRWELRKTLNIMREDFLELNPANILSISNGNEIYFKKINGDKVRYSYLNQTLSRRKNSEAWEVLLTNVTTPPFAYFDSNMNPINNKNEIVYIKASLAVNKNGNVRSAEDLFFLRNLTIKQPKIGNDSDDDKDHDHKDDDDDDDNNHQHHHRHRHGED